MSRAPHNPFETAPDQFGQPASESSKTWLWVLGIIGAVFLFGTVLCCGLMFYAWDQASGVIAQVAVEEYADDPILKEKIGTIQSSQMSLREAMEESTQDETSTAMVFTIEGDKGRGKLIHRTNDQTEQVTVKLVMENGEEFDLEVRQTFGDLETELEGDGEPVENGELEGPGEPESIAPGETQTEPTETVETPETDQP
ncbi:hypothetical protein Enr13x_73090 [Stieleria neptunia]|uniref:Cytochrome oxidase complex assembly protein 1 n=1 Tax=Stieleria neptunia TaxID=2527979 RepID=A0A518I2R7_9BACT|nr:hypothetical protein [Stieleria neptunia]QDV47400.1 hypothetical protein Enr13x_73090 [Stieleria neptunia]